MRDVGRGIAMAVLAAAVALAAGAQTAQEVEPPSLRAEMAALNATMTRIAELLERQLEGQKVELVMARVRLTSERSQRTEDALREAEKERSSLEEQREQIQLSYKSFIASIENSNEASVEQIARMRDQFEAQSKQLDARLSTVAQRVAELQNQLATQQAEAQEWQDFADRLLGAL